MKNILVFFTFNYDLNLWVSSGIFYREINYYIRIAKKYGHRFSFLTYGDKDDLKYLDNNFSQYIEIIPLFKKKPRNKLIMLILSILFIFKNKQILNSFDIYKTNQNYGSWLAVIAKFIYKKKLISRSGYDLFHFSLKKKNILKIFLSYFICLINYKFADRVIIPTIFYKNFIYKCFKIKKEKIHIIGNYVDLNLFKFTERNYNKTKFNYCFIGRLEKQKNLFFLINSFKNNKNDSLSIYGSGSLERQIKEKIKINKSISLINKKFNHEEIPNIFKKFDFFILPSDFEGCPKILLEAMSTGLIPIVKKIENHDEIIVDNQSGFFIQKNKNIIFLTQKIDKSLLQKISYKAHETIKNKFDINNLIEIENQIYKSFDK